jgi:hypothetical protein
MYLASIPSYEADTDEKEQAEAVEGFDDLQNFLE